MLSVFSLLSVIPLKFAQPKFEKELSIIIPVLQVGKLRFREVAPDLRDIKQLVSEQYGVRSRCPDASPGPFPLYHVVSLGTGIPSNLSHHCTGLVQSQG